MIDRYLVRYFLAVIDCGSFSKAAKQLNVAQPTLSVGIGKLERLLAAKLFQRTSKRVNLTEAGSRLALHARRIEKEFNHAESAVMDMKPVRSLRLGVISTFPIANLAQVIRSARRGEETERLAIVIGNESELLQRLSRGQLDAALTIVRNDADRFAAEVLLSEGYALALAGDHRLAGRAVIKAEELTNETMIVRRHCEVLSETSKHFTERGVRPFLAFRGTNDEQVLTLVHAGLGVTVMPASYAMKGVARPQLAGFDLTRCLGLMYSSQADALQHAASPTLQAIRTHYAPRKRSKPGELHTTDKSLR